MRGNTIPYCSIFLENAMLLFRCIASDGAMHVVIHVCVLLSSIHKARVLDSSACNVFHVSSAKGDLHDGGKRYKHEPSKLSNVGLTELILLGDRSCFVSDFAHGSEKDWSLKKNESRFEKEESPKRASLHRASPDQSSRRTHRFCRSRKTFFFIPQESQQC